MRSVIFILVILTIVSGCSSNPTAKPATWTPQPTWTPVHMPTDTTETATVSRVVDGDTLDVLLESGKTDRVRILGIDTPETFSSNKADEYNGITDIECLDLWGTKLPYLPKISLKTKR